MAISDDVANLLGRFVDNSAWLDDVLGEAVVLGNPAATEMAESTPDLAASGERLVAAVRGIQVPGPLAGMLADRLAKLNETRNHLVHGVWLWSDDAVLVMRRALGKGERQVKYASYKYAFIEDVIREYQVVGKLADRLVEILMSNNPALEAMEAKYVCEVDGGRTEGVIIGEDIVQECTMCGHRQPAVPKDSAP
jgi:hypothetical protein